MAAGILNPVLTVFGTPGAPPAGPAPYSVLGASAPGGADRATGFLAAGAGAINVKLKTARSDGSTALVLDLSGGRLGAAVEFTEITAADASVWPVTVEYFGHGTVALNASATAVTGTVDVVGDGPRPAAEGVAVVSVEPIPRTAHIPSIVLPAAGAFTAITDPAFYPAGPYAIPASLGTICFWVVYQRAAVNGYPVVRPRFSNGTEAGRYPVVRDTLDASFTPSARQSVFNLEYSFPPPGVAAAFAYAPIWFRIPPGATLAWLEVAEDGDTGAPGTISVAITGDYRT